MRGIIASVLVLSLLGPLVRPLPAAASVWVVDTATRTELQVQQEWARRKPAHTGSAYTVAPGTKAPYATGTLAPGFLADGLAMLNYARFLAGLPADVDLSSTRTAEAQHGAVLLAANGVLSHYPTKPADMSQSFYDAGYASASTSNIGFGQATLASFQSRCLGDNSSVSNLQSVGHRRWILNPPMRYTGMGYANGWTTTYAFDRSRTHDVSYSAISWPSAGAFPVQMFCSNTPWSVTLNPAVFDIDQSSTQHTVTLRRVGDGRTWSFNSGHTSTAGHYFSTDFRWMGVPNVFVFRPDPSTVTYRPGDQFDVTLSVYVKGSASPRTLSYRTRFVSMYQRDAYEPDDTRASARRISLGQKQSRSFDYDGDRDWAYFDARKGVKLQIASPGVKAELYDSVGKRLTTFDGSKTASWTPPADGRYYILLQGSPVGYDPRRYELSVVDPAAVAISVEGDTRYCTAIEAARRAFPDGARTAILATGENFPDALAAAPLAGVLDAPILLVPGTLSTAGRVSALDSTLSYARNELKASRVFVLGGTLAVDDAVRKKIVAAFGSSNVISVSGGTRYDTANELARRAIAELKAAGVSWDGTAFLSTGQNFPDALAAAPLAASAGWPVYLTSGSSFTESTRDAMKKAGVKKVIVLGGELAVSAATYGQVASAFGSVNVARVAGNTRYDTAVKIATLAVNGSIAETSKLGISVKDRHGWDRVGITTGQNFPDALAGGVLQGKAGSTMLLTNPTKLSEPTGKVLASQRGDIEMVTFFGGPLALSQDVRDAVIQSAIFP